MSKNASIILPSLRRILSTVGENIRLARLRRKYSASMVAERAGISRNTLRAIENGEPTVSFGAYANVLMSLGLEQDICLLASDDQLGRKLQDAKLPVRARAPRTMRNVKRSSTRLDSNKKPKKKAVEPTLKTHKNKFKNEKN